MPLGDCVIFHNIVDKTVLLILKIFSMGFQGVEMLLHLSYHLIQIIPPYSLHQMVIYSGDGGIDPTAKSSKYYIYEIYYF